MEIWRITQLNLGSELIGLFIYKCKRPIGIGSEFHFCAEPIQVFVRLLREAIDGQFCLRLEPFVPCNIHPRSWSQRWLDAIQNPLDGSFNN